MSGTGRLGQVGEVVCSVSEQLRFAAFREDIGTVVPARLDGEAAWLAGVVLGGRGHYAAAAAHLGPLVRGRDPVLAALASATRASHLRQVGGHAAARRLDAAGLRKLDGIRHPEARSDVLLGLAADAVGLGKLDEARALVDLDTDDAGPRAEVRRGWLRAEIALAAGNARAAVAPAREALAHDYPSERHRVKSAIVLGVALGAAGEAEEAIELLERNLREAIRRRLLPLVWPAALVLGELGRSGHKELAGETLHCVLRHSDPIARREAERSPWVPTWLFASAPNR